MPLDHLDRVNLFGEVFTPREYAAALLELADNSVWCDPNVLLVEPSCGDGAIATELLRRRIDGLVRAGYDPRSAVATSVGTLWAIDIQQDNVDLCRSNLLRVVLDYVEKNDLLFLAAIAAAIEYQVRVGDSLCFTYPAQTFLALCEKEQQKAAQWKYEALTALLSGEHRDTWLADVFVYTVSPAASDSASPWTPRIVAQFRELWDDGITTREIARRLGITDSAIRNKARALDFPLRGSPIPGRNADLPIFSFEDDGL